MVILINGNKVLKCIQLHDEESNYEQNIDFWT